MIDPNENYKDLISKFDRLEDSGNLSRETIKETNPEASNMVDKFLKDPENKKYMNSEQLNRLQEKENTVRKNSEPKESVNLMEKMIKEIDWSLVKRLYKYGIKKGFIE